MDEGSDADAGEVGGGAVGGDGEVELAIVIEVADGDGAPQCGAGRLRDGGGGGGEEGSVALAEEELGLRGVDGDGGVEVAGGGEGSEGGGLGGGSGGEGARGLEGSVAVSEEDGDAFGGVDGEVEEAVVVEVGGDVGRVAGGSGGSGVEDALEAEVLDSLAEQGGDAGGGDGEGVEEAVIVEVGGDDEVAAVAGGARRAGRCRRWSGGLEGAVAVAGEDVDVAGGAFDDEVGDAVEVYVLDQEGVDAGGSGEAGSGLTKVPSPFPRKMLAPSEHWMMTSSLPSLLRSAMEMGPEPLGSGRMATV